VAGPAGLLRLHDPPPRRHQAGPGGYGDQGATVIKAAGRITGRTSQGRLKVEADGRQLSAQHVTLATGSQAIHPDNPGLGAGSAVPVWTNRKATNLADIPDRVLMIGGSAVAVELGQFLARMGSQVTLVQRGERQMSREEPRAGELAQAAREADGIRARLNSQLTARPERSSPTCSTGPCSGTPADHRLASAPRRRPSTRSLGDRDPHCR